MSQQAQQQQQGRFLLQDHTVEDELNFVLGHDGDAGGNGGGEGRDPESHLSLDLDAALGAAAEEFAALPSAPASRSASPSMLDSLLTQGDFDRGASTAGMGADMDHGGRQEDVLGFLMSGAAECRNGALAGHGGSSFPPQGLPFAAATAQRPSWQDAFLDSYSSIMNSQDPLAKFSSQELDDLRVDLGLSLPELDEFLPPSSRSLGPVEAADPSCFDRDLNFGIGADAPFQKKRPRKKWGPVCSYPPVVHPPHRSDEPKRPLRKRKFRGASDGLDFDFNLDLAPESRSRPASPCFDLDAALQSVECEANAAALAASEAEAKAAAAREARARRRLARAPGQAIHLVGGGDVAKVGREAAEDAKGACGRSGARASDEEAARLAEFFASGWTPERFVRETWDLARRSMVEASRAAEANAKRVDATPPSEVRSYVNDRLCHDALVSATANAPRPEVEGELAVVVPVTPSPDAEKQKKPSKKLEKPSPPPNEALKSLPDGKDPESRRLRRLMRNRLSAQASRDRRRRAIEEAERERRDKEATIAGLEEQAAQEADRLILLEKAVNFARDHLGVNLSEILIEPV